MGVSPLYPNRKICSISKQAKHPHKFFGVFYERERINWKALCKKLYWYSWRLYKVN